MGNVSTMMGVFAVSVIWVMYSMRLAECVEVRRRGWVYIKLCGKPVVDGGRLRRRLSFPFYMMALYVTLNLNL